MEQEKNNQILTSISDGIEYYLRKYGISYEQLLCGNECNTLFHNDILNLIATNVTTESDIINLQEYYSSHKNSLPYSSDVKTIFKLYIQDFYNAFYKLENNQIVAKDKNNFIIKPSESIKNNPIIDDKRSPIIIMKDGTSYVSPKDHIDLVNWFVLSENIDFKDALRIVMYAKNGDFEVSSMYGYIPTKDMSPMYLYYDQAERMRDFYIYTCDKHKHVKSVDMILLTSTGLGLGKYDTNSENEAFDYNALRNLKVLANTFDEEEFDVSLYKSTIKSLRENKMM